MSKGNNQVLKLGIPKGSLEAQTLELMRKSGWRISIDARSYLPKIDDPALSCRLMRPQEMPRYIEDGSLDAGIQNNPLSPAVLTTSQAESPVTLTPGFASVPFLAFNNGVMERGYRALWELHMAYYYQGLSLLGAWDKAPGLLLIGDSAVSPSGKA